MTNGTTHPGFTWDHEEGSKIPFSHFRDLLERSLVKLEHRLWQGQKLPFYVRQGNALIAEDRIISNLLNKVI